MTTAAEHLYVPCTCTGGMRDGERCADCRGRGVVPKGTKPTGESIPSEEPTVDEEDPLLQLGMAELRERCRELGVGAGGGRAALVARIREAEAAAELADQLGENENQGDGQGDGDAADGDGQGDDSGEEPNEDGQAS